MKQKKIKDFGYAFNCGRRERGGTLQPLCLITAGLQLVWVEEKGPTAAKNKEKKNKTRVSFLLSPIFQHSHPQSFFPASKATTTTDRELVKTGSAKSNS